MTYVVDTNIVLRIMQPAHDMHHSAVQSVALLVGQGIKLCILPQCIYECWVVCTRPVVAQNGLGLTAAEAQAEITQIKTHFVLLPDIPTIFPLWEHLVFQHSVMGKPAHDARIVAAMKAHSITQLLTFNKSDFTRYPGISVETPNEVILALNPPPAS